MGDMGDTGVDAAVFPCFRGALAGGALGTEIGA